MSNKNAIIGILAGMTGGILIGIGFNSKKGRAFRKKLMENVDEYLELIPDKLTSILGGSVQQLKDAGKDTKILK